MKNTVKAYMLGVLSTVFLLGCVAYAASNTKTIEAIYNNIKIYVDGIKIDPKDADGNTVEPFIYNGTTYLPVRAVGEAVGKTVTWDGGTQSVYLGQVPGTVQYLTDVCPPYGGHWYALYKSSEGKFLTISGKKYTDILEIAANGHALFNLDGKYKKLTFAIGRVDTQASKNVTMNIYLDGKLVETMPLKGDDLPQKVSIDLNYALHMKIELTLTDNQGTHYGLTNAILE